MGPGAPQANGNLSGGGGMPLIVVLMLVWLILWEHN